MANVKWTMQKDPGIGDYSLKGGEMIGGRPGRHP